MGRARFVRSGGGVLYFVLSFMTWWYFVCIHAIERRACLWLACMFVPTLAIAEWINFVFVFYAKGNRPCEVVVVVLAREDWVFAPSI